MPDRLIILLFFITVAIIGYLLGSVNFAIIITRFFTGQDVRALGSGNAGMTNVMRSAGFWPGALTFLGDFLKAILAGAMGKYILIGFLVPPSPITLTADIAAAAPIYGAAIGGFFCMVGHMFPLFFGFRGGKGITTTAGVVLVLDWRAFLITIGIFIVAFLITRIVSLSSLIAAVCYPAVTYVCFSLLPSSDEVNRAAMNAFRPLGIPLQWFVTLIAAAASLIIIIKHKDNIVRLCRGEEKRLKLKKSR